MRKLLLATAVALLAGCASGRPIELHTASDAAVFADAEPVEVRLSNFKFTPQTIHLVKGRPYRLTIVNEASGGHSFGAPDFFEAAQIAPDDAGQVSDGKIEVDGKSSKTIALIPAAGIYKLDCTHFGHAALGMSGQILVE